MGRGSKAKGSRYEREFVQICQDYGIPAHRVPLSGALGGRFSDDVVVGDTWRIECKYRATGTGFKRLYGWLGACELLQLITPGGDIWLVYPMHVWLESRRMTLDDSGRIYTDITQKDVASLDTLKGWIGGADYLALRMPHERWLVAELSHAT